MNEVKRTYYINVGTGEVLEDPTTLDVQFEIQATEEDIAKLQELLEEVDNTSQNSYGATWFPWQVYYSVPQDQEYDYYLTEVYRAIHRLGNEHTRRHIESMNVLNQGV
ncbi:hypothetical protein ABE504_09135 [Paenibacillus oryzisoli]|uniref:hypothetical protein n=1 Tax=Paenibacillus oryzisoli TaxID=1850517 RepID=UPI003D2DF13C